MKTLDNRGLTPPQPMMRTLAALEELEDGEALMIINDRKPMFLYPELEALGYTHETSEREDGSFQIIIRKLK